jgi:SAM-dependent methyltransferase
MMSNPENDLRGYEEPHLEKASFSFHRWQLASLPIEDLDLRRLCDREHPVMYWAPRRVEIERIVETAVQLHEGPGLPTILEVGCGSGLLSYLMASTGRVRVIASDPDPAHFDRTVYSHPNLSMVVADAASIRSKLPDVEFDCVLNSWMPPEVNLTPDIRKLEARAIIYVLERTGETGVPESHARWLSYRHGSYLEDYISYRPGEEYFRALSWNGPAHWEITEYFRGFSYSPSITDSNIIEIQLRRDQRKFLPATVSALCDINNREMPRFAWEAELERFKGATAGRINILDHEDGP